MREERQHGGVCPMQILEHQYRRALRGQSVEEAPPCGERLLLCRRLTAGTHEWAKAALDPVPVRLVVRDGRVQLRCRIVGAVRFQDAALSLDYLAKSPEGDPLAIGERTALPPARESGALVEVA